MNAQRQIDVDRVKDYKSLAEELCDIYYPASKTEIADAIGISQKSIYNMIYGEKTGVYMQKRLSKFLRDNFGLQIKNLKGEFIKLTPAVNISNNTITNSNVSGGSEPKQKTTDNLSAVDNSQAVIDLNTELLQLLLSDNKELKRKLANLENENSSLTQEIIKLKKELIEINEESIKQRFEKLDKKFSK